MKPSFSTPSSSSSSSYYDDDDKGRTMMMIRDKIQSAFSSVSSLRIINDGLIQFWKTSSIGSSSSRLSTEDQPFVLEDLKGGGSGYTLPKLHQISTSSLSNKNPPPHFTPNFPKLHQNGGTTFTKLSQIPPDHFSKMDAAVLPKSHSLPPKDPLAYEYRLFSLKCQHTITTTSSIIIHPVKEEEEDPAAAACCLTNITNGPHAAALMAPHFPRVLLNLKRKKGSSPLVDKALDCGMTCLILLPVFYQLKFVGVVECCLKSTSGTGLVFKKLNLALERVGLLTYHAQQGLLPAKLTMHGFNRAQDEIEEALKIVCASHQVALAQVWINSSDIVVSSSPSSLLVENKQSSTDDPTKQGMPVVKLCGYLPDNYDDASYLDFKGYYDACDVLTSEPGEGFPGRTLQTHKSFFCKNLCYLKMSHNDGLLGAFRLKTGSSCFNICLRSTHTGSSVDYAFEFLWSCRRQNQSVLLECLLLTLKMCLPSFKFASGAQLGEELSVFDVTANHQLVDSSTADQIPSFKLLQGNRLAQTTLVPKELQRPDHGKRKLHDLYDGGKCKKTDELSDFPLHDHLLEAEYRETRTVLELQRSYTLACVKKEVEKHFNLDPGSCTLEYEHRGEKVMLNTDENLSSCIKLWRSMNRYKTIDRRVLFKVRVLLSSDVQINKWLSSNGLAHQP